MLARVVIFAFIINKKPSPALAIDVVPKATIETIRMPLLQELLMALRAIVSNYFKSWLVLGVEELGGWDAATEV